MKPYSLACSAVNQRSRSESASICSTELAGVLGDELGHLLLDVQHLLGLDLDVGGGAADAAGGLVHHDRACGRRSACPVPGAEQELPHRGGQPHRDRGDVVGIHCMVSKIAMPAVTEPPGELM
jgi:hypothetical protein